MRAHTCVRPYDPNFLVAHIKVEEKKKYNWMGNNNKKKKEEEKIAKWLFNVCEFAVFFDAKK